MTVELNGRATGLPHGASLAEAVAAAGVRADEPGVAAAVDGEVVRREQWASLRLREGQSVEVVRAVQGG